MEGSDDSLDIVYLDDLTALGTQDGDLLGHQWTSSFLKPSATAAIIE